MVDIAAITSIFPLDSYVYLLSGRVIFLKIHVFNLKILSSSSRLPAKMGLTFAESPIDTNTKSDTNAFIYIAIIMRVSNGKYDQWFHLA